MIRTVLWFFVAGVLLAIIIEALGRTAGYYSATGYAIERVARVLWPTSLFKMALDDGKDTGFQVAAVYGISFVANGLLYGFIGFLVGVAKKLLFRPEQSSRKSTSLI